MNLSAIPLSLSGNRKLISAKIIFIRLFNSKTAKYFQLFDLNFAAELYL